MLEDGASDDEGSSSSRAQYVSANCVVFTHYTGDVAAVVDEHFSRALSYSEKSSSGSKGNPIIYLLYFSFAYNQKLLKLIISNARHPETIDN